MPTKIAKSKFYKKAIHPAYDRTVFDILHAAKGIPAKEIAEKTFISVQTIYNMRKGPKFGGTRYPRMLTMTAIAKAIGLEFILVKADSNSAKQESINAPADSWPKPVPRKKKKLTKLEVVSDNESLQIGIEPVKRSKAKGKKPEKQPAKLKKGKATKALRNSKVIAFPTAKSDIPLKKAV